MSEISLDEKVLPADIRIFIGGKEISIEEAKRRLAEDMFLMQPGYQPQIKLVYGGDGVMTVSWWALLKAIPGIRDAVKPIGESKSWTGSTTIWYNILKTVGVVLAAVGFYGIIPEQDLQSISAGLAILIPTVCTVMDGVVNIWLRLRASQPITGTVQAKKVEVLVAAKTEEIVQETTDKVIDQCAQQDGCY